MRLAVDRRPIGQLVVIGVAVVEEAAFLDDQTPRVDAGPIATVPAERSRARQLLDRGDGAGDMFALGLGVELVMIDPAPTVATNVVAVAHHGLGDRRVALERQRAGEEGGRQAALLEQPDHPPDADARAVFVHRFHGQVALAGRYAPASDLGQPHLGLAIALGDRVLRALFVVDHELHRDAGAAGPIRMGRLRAVADQIARRARQGRRIGRSFAHGRILYLDEICANHCILRHNRPIVQSSNRPRRAT